jgi:pimeloyl-[acyl-carrier protein] methyl ester esterase
MPHLETNRLKWHYEMEGPDGAPPLLFIHGWGVDSRIWRQQVKHFVQYYRVVVIDLPGHGKSSWKKISLAEIADDIIVLLDKLGIKETSVVGSSLGGLVALKIFSGHPKKIKCLTLVGSHFKFAKSDDYPYGLDVERIRKLGGQLQTDYPAIVNIFFRSLFTKAERSTRRFKWIQTFRSSISMPEKEALMGLLEILEKEDLRPGLSKINVPIQFINGTEDYIFPKETFLHLKERAPQAKFDWLEECGHFPFLSKPYEFNEILERFLIKCS